MSRTIGEKPDRTWWTRGTLHMHINRRSSIIVSRSVPIFWFPFDIFSIKPISRALFGHVGSTVCTIPSHGAVARSVAARAHTAFPACNLRLTFNLPSFTTSTVNLSRRSEVNSQTPLLLFFNIHYQLLRCLHKVSAQTLFLPMKGNPTWPFSPCDSLGRNLGQFTTVLPSNI